MEFISVNIYFNNIIKYLSIVTLLLEPLYLLIYGSYLCWGKNIISKWYQVFLFVIMSYFKVYLLFDVFTFLNIFNLKGLKLYV